MEKLTTGELATLVLMCAAVVLGGLYGAVAVGNPVAALGGAAIAGAAALCLVILVPLGLAAIGAPFRRR